jgi:hypothetical protein
MPSTSLTNCRDPHEPQHQPGGFAVIDPAQLDHEFDEALPDNSGSLLYREQNDSLLYQTNPFYGSRDERQKSFTYSVKSYIKAAQKAVNEVMESGVKPLWFAVVRVDDLLTAQQHNDQWKNKISRRLRSKGVVALFTREVTKVGIGKLHYNFLVVSPQDGDEAERLLRWAFEGTTINFDIQRCGKTRKDLLYLLNYIFKAKVQGKIEEGPLDKIGEHTSDKYSWVRVLFNRYSPLHKWRTIGKFFPDRKAAKQRVKEHTVAYHSQLEREEILLDQSTIDERKQARELAPYGEVVNVSAREILLDLVKTRLNEQGNQEHP